MPTRRIPIPSARLGTCSHTPVVRQRRHAPGHRGWLPRFATRVAARAAARAAVRAAGRSAVRTLTLVVAAVLPVAVQAQGAPTLAPTVASVQEAEPVPFHPAPGTDLSRVRGVGVVGEPTLSVAWLDARDGLLWVSFRLAGDRSAYVERLTLSTSDGAVHDVAAGQVEVRPAADPDAPLVAIADLVESAPPPSARTSAWLFENRSDEPVRVEAITYAPTGAVGDVVLAKRFGGADARAAFDLWVRSIEAVVAEASVEGGDGDSDGDGDTDGSRARLEAEIRNVFAADLHRVDPAGQLAGVLGGQRLAPGDALGLVLTPVAFASHVAGATLLIDPAVVTLSAGGVRRVAFSAGPTVRPHAP